MWSRARASEQACECLLLLAPGELLLPPARLARFARSPVSGQRSVRSSVVILLLAAPRRSYGLLLRPPPLPEVPGSRHGRVARAAWGASHSCGPLYTVRQRRHALGMGTASARGLRNACSSVASSLLQLAVTELTSPYALVLTRAACIVRIGQRTW